jgi:toxin ParE1/3/4
MKKFEVRFRPQALSDLFGLYRFIAAEAGHRVASGYIDRIEATCRSLETFPERGTSHHDVRPGLRTMGFERRATVAFIVGEDHVRVIRVFYGGRNYERLLRSSAAADADEI